MVGMLVFQPISSLVSQTPWAGVGWILPDVVLWAAFATWGVARIRAARGRERSGPRAPYDITARR
jgi:hypothetical protein